MTAEFNQDPDRIRAGIEALLAQLPGEDELVELPTQAALDELARRLGEAHDALVHALESVEKG